MQLHLVAGGNFLPAASTLFVSLVTVTQKIHSRREFNTMRSIYSNENRRRFKYQEYVVTHMYIQTERALINAFQECQYKSAYLRRFVGTCC